MIIVRTLRRDIAKYNKIEDEVSIPTNFVTFVLLSKNWVNSTGILKILFGFSAFIQTSTVRCYQINMVNMVKERC